MRTARGTVRTGTAVLAVLTAALAGPGPEGGRVDGFTIGHVPAALAQGAEVEASETSYEWGGARFTARMWERALPGGGFRVELQVLVVRGEALSDLREVRAFLSEYHGHPWAVGDLEEFDHGGAPGYMGTLEAFWLHEPGVAVEVRDSAGVLGPGELRRTALGVRPADG
ncbi:hypothetical protein [Nocardiopsis baichengensis]|uniref:hypothetical protein n=1 Tax=Nocardiopsis baichengensis TaxID=280240 RepID=UPI0003468B0E|nr:hypothetical protein [Nocardiopsis baichengensis]